MSRFLLRLGERAFVLAHGEQILGRGEEADIVVDDALVSRQHARFRVSELAVEVEDLGSRNGIAVDGTRISRPTPLAHGAVLSIASLRLVVVDLRLRKDPETLRVQSAVPRGERPAPAHAAGMTRSTASRGPRPGR